MSSNATTYLHCRHKEFDIVSKGVVNSLQEQSIANKTPTMLTRWTVAVVKIKLLFEVHCTHRSNCCMNVPHMFVAAFLPVAVVEEQQQLGNGEISAGKGVIQVTRLLLLDVRGEC